MGLITVKVFDNSIEAHLLKSRLEHENISCYLFDENTVALNPIWNITVGGIKLKIQEKDIEKVRKIITEIENTQILDEENNVLKCSNCESSDLISGFESMKGFRGLLTVFISFALMVFPIHYDTRYKCKKCNFEFEA